MGSIIEAVSAWIVGCISSWGYLGIVPLLTGLIGSCPLYTLFGFSTCPVKKGS